MPDSATTSTLAVVALSGGTGAFLGVVVNQVVQLKRDRTQFAREDARHERERQEGLDDELRRRREDKYVSLLTTLTDLDRPLQGLADLLPEVVLNREKTDGPDAIGETDRALAEACAVGCLRTWESVETAHRDLAAAFFATYAVASPAARDQGVRIVDWPLTIAGIELQVCSASTTSSSFRFGMSTGFRTWTGRGYSEHLIGRIGELRGLLAQLDRRLREELRLA